VQQPPARHADRIRGTGRRTNPGLSRAAVQHACRVDTGSARSECPMYARHRWKRQTGLRPRTGGKRGPRHRRQVRPGLRPGLTCYFCGAKGTRTPDPHIERHALLELARIEVQSRYNDVPRSTPRPISESGSATRDYTARCRHFGWDRAVRLPVGSPWETPAEHLTPMTSSQDVNFADNDITMLQHYDCDRQRYPEEPLSRENATVTKVAQICGQLPIGSTRHHLGDESAG
jgi:hypothetical protein